MAAIFIILDYFECDVSNSARDTANCIYRQILSFIVAYLFRRLHRVLNLTLKRRDAHNATKDSV